MKRTLRLRKETLTEITDVDLAGVAGGQLLTNFSCPLKDCIRTTTHPPTLPLDECLDPPTFPQNCYTLPWC